MTASETALAPRLQRCHYQQQIPLEPRNIKKPIQHCLYITWAQWAQWASPSISKFWKILSLLWSFPKSHGGTPVLMNFLCGKSHENHPAIGGLPIKKAPYFEVDPTPVPISRALRMPQSHRRCFWNLTGQVTLGPAGAPLGEMLGITSIYRICIDNTSIVTIFIYRIV